MKKLQRRQHQPNGTEQSDDKTKGSNRSRKSKNKIKNAHIEEGEDEEDLVDEGEKKIIYFF
jgi:hypothetical protein